MKMTLDIYKTFNGNEETKVLNAKIIPAEATTIRAEVLSWSRFCARVISSTYEFLGRDKKTFKDNVVT